MTNATREILSTEQRTCPQHGAYSAHREDIRLASGALLGMAFWTSCPTCDAAIQREVDARDAEIQGLANRKSELLRLRILGSGIPKRLAECTIWNWQHGPDHQRKAWQWVRDYVGALDLALETGRSVVLTGAEGTGKSHLAVGILRHVIEKGGTARYTTVAEFMARLRTSYNHSGETEKSIFDDVTKCDFLCLDEIGKNTGTAFDCSQFFRVIERRHADCKPTVLVSNLARDAFLAFVGPAIADRLREAGGAILVFDWPSQRSSRVKEAEHERR